MGLGRWEEKLIPAPTPVHTRVRSNTLNLKQWNAFCRLLALWAFDKEAVEFQAHPLSPCTVDRWHCHTSFMLIIHNREAHKK